MERRSLLTLTSFLGSSALLAWLLWGCAAATKNKSSQPKPGNGIAEYREVTREAQRSLTMTVQALDALASSPPDGSKPHRALRRFDRAMQELELTSARTRARAEAIMARGQAYFDEWKEQMALATNQATARADAERYALLHGHFDQVRDRSGEVRTQFRPFMMSLREFRAALDQPANQAGVISTNVAGLAVQGRRVLESLEGVAKSLDDAEAQLHAAPFSAP